MRCAPCTWAMFSGTVCATVSQTSAKFQSPAIGSILCRIILYLEIVLNTEFKQASIGDARMPKSVMQPPVLAVTVPYRPLEVRWSASALSENHHMLPRQRAGGALPHQGVGSGFLADLGFAHFVGGFDGHTRVFQPVFHIRDAATGL